MAHQALIRGEVCFRAGDGALIPIPAGEIDIEMGEEDVTLGWTDGQGNTGSTAITRDEYDRYVEAGNIRPKNSILLSGR